MNTKGKTRNTSKTPKHSPDFVKVTFQEVDSYRDKFAEWLTDKAGKEARGAFFALWAIEIFSRVNVSTFDKEVARARRTLQKFLRHTYKPENQAGLHEYHIDTRGCACVVGLLLYIGSISKLFLEAADSPAFSAPIKSGGSFFTPETVQFSEVYSEKTGR